MGRRSQTGGITPAGDRIQIRFAWQGKELRPTLALKPSAANLKHAGRIRGAILADIKAGTFKLSEYFPDYRFGSKHEVDENPRTFSQWCKVWASLSARALEDSTLQIYKRHLAAYWEKPFGAMRPKQITNEKILTRLAYLASEHLDEKSGLLRKPLSRKTQNNIMIPLRGVFELICKADTHLKDPTEGIDNLKSQKAPPDPFAIEEVEAILDTLRKHSGEVLADYFEFSFFSGLRISEQIALLWQDVDFRGRTVKVRRARVLGKDKERTKTNVERDVELNTRAYGALERQRARTQLKDGHVFYNPSTDKPWHDDQEQRRDWKQALHLANIRYRPPKECRDTSVTLALIAGANLVWVAGQHGHSVQVMMRDYAKWIPRADHGSNLEKVNQALDFRSRTAVDLEAKK